MNAPASPPSHRILVVDDNETIHADFRKILAPSHDGEAQLLASEALLFGSEAASRPAALPAYQVDSAFQGQQGLQMVERALAEGSPYSLAFIDVRMPPGWDGIQTVEHIWQKDPDLPVVICTAYSDYSWADMTARLGSADNLVVLRKPFEPVEVLQLTHSLTTKWLLGRKVRRQLQELDELVAARTRSLEQANHALRQSEERFAKAFQHNPVPALLADAADLLWVDINESFQALTGYARDEVLTASAVATAKLFPQPGLHHDLSQAARRRQSLRDRESELRTRDGRTLAVLISAEPLELLERPHLLISVQDITERLNMENQLRQAQKMEAVGQIAAGVAHDFNNILAVIQGHVELQLSAASRDPSLLDSLHEISGAADRAASLTRQLLAFSRKQMLRLRPLNVPDVLASLGKMLQRIIGEDIRLTIRCPAHLPPVLADQTNLEQIVINLAVNGRDAMPHGGPLTITAQAVNLQASDKELQPDAIPGRFIKLSVADAGTGMDENVRRKIFEPFFTTKAVGKGTGMGLATVYGVVKQHHGWIEVQSAPGHGSTFSVYLPLAHGEVVKTSEGGTDLIRASGAKSKTILVVEDEAPLRDLAAKILRKLGYEVVTAATGPEALRLWPQWRDKVALVFTDMTMPDGMTGRELAGQLQREKPGLPVVYCTGYSVDFSHPDLNLVEGENLLLKPYDATALTRIMKKSLGFAG